MNWNVVNLKVGDQVGVMRLRGMYPPEPLQLAVVEKINKRGHITVSGTVYDKKGDERVEDGRRYGKFLCSVERVETERKERIEQRRLDQIGVKLLGVIEGCRFNGGQYRLDETTKQRLIELANEI